MSLKISSSPQEEKPETPETTPAETSETTPAKAPEAAAPSPAIAPSPAVAPSPPPAEKAPPKPPPPKAPPPDRSRFREAASEMPELKVKTSTNIIQRLFEFIGSILKRNRKKMIISGGCAALLGVGAAAWYHFLYPAMLLKSGEDFMIGGEYEKVRGYITAYHNTGTSSDASKLLLARAFLFDGDPVGAKDVIGDSPLEDPELQYIQAIGGFEDPEEAAVQLDIIRFDGGMPPYAVGARGMLAMLDGNNAAAAAAFSKLRDIQTEPDDLTERHLRALFNILMSKLEPRIRSEAKLTFTLPKVQGKIENSRVSSGPEGFERSFGVPFDVLALRYDTEKTSVQDFIRGLELLSDIQNTPDNASEIINSRTDAAESVLSQFIIAHDHIKNERFVEAAAIYANIGTLDPGNPLAKQYEGTAIWLSQNGELPDQQVLSAYESAININPQNSAALNNLAFLNLNLGEIEKAKSLIDRAAAIDNVNPHIVFNVLVINVVNGSTDSEHSLTQIESLVNRWPNSLVVLELASEISILSQLLSDAIGYLEKIMERAPSAKHAERIADLYRHTGQFIIAISELQKAHELFPHSNDLTGLIALYYAKSGNYKTAAETMQKYNLPIGGPVGLYIRAIANDDNEAGEKAFELALPSQKTDIAMELTRIHFRNEDPELAAESFKLARDNADVSNSLDLETSLEALKLRLDSEDSNSPELETQINRLAAKAGKSENASALLDLVWSYYNIRSYQAGIDLLTLIRRQPARLPLLRRALIIGHEQLGNLNDVARIRGEAYDEIVEAESELSFEQYDTRLSLLKAINSAVRGQEHELALGLYQGLTQGKFYDPQKAAVDHQNRGSLHMVLHNFKNAVADFRKGIELAVDDEQRETIHYNYVQALVQTRDYINAEKELKKIIDDADPEFKHLRIYQQLLAGVLFFQGKLDRSRIAYMALISKYPKDPNNYIGIANVNIRQEKFEQAIAVLVDGLDVAPDNTNIHRLLQTLYHRMGRIEDSERHKKIIENIQKSS